MPKYCPICWTCGDGSVCDTVLNQNVLVTNLYLQDVLLFIRLDAKVLAHLLYLGGQERLRHSTLMKRACDKSVLPKCISPGPA
jgi:hypothetical protein